MNKIKLLLFSIKGIGINDSNKGIVKSGYHKVYGLENQLVFISKGDDKRIQSLGIK